MRKITTLREPCVSLFSYALTWDKICARESSILECNASKREWAKVLLVVYNSYIYSISAVPVILFIVVLFASTVGFWQAALLKEL